MENSNGRQQFTVNGRIIFEWEQSIDEVHVYISPPPHITVSDLNIKILPSHLLIGLKPHCLSPSLSVEGKQRATPSSSIDSSSTSGHNTAAAAVQRGSGNSREADASDGGVAAKATFIDEDLYSLVFQDESFWMMEDRELHIQLGKVKKGEVWPCVLRCQSALDPWAQKQAKEKIMLERFQEENPGFDFSGASFSGEAPDPRKFMGGISYK